MKQVNTIFILVVTISLLMTSCFREDEPLPPYVSPPGVHTTSANMGPLYGKQLFYDLETDSFIRIIDRDSWDLAFSAEDNQHAIFLNSSKFMRVVNTGSTNFSQTFSSAGWEWRIDNSGGWPDSTAIGEWGNVNQLNVVSNQYVYLIDRGYTANGNVIGYKKLQVIELTNQTYKVRFANLDGSQEQTISLNKDAAYNFLFLSFTQGIVEIEPPKAEWDLLFSQYATPVLQESTGIYEDYSVNGILLNPYLVTATRCFDKPFSELQYSDIGLYSFSKKRDIIGYDWKVFDFDLSTYIIVSNNCYMIKNVDGDYYKLRVISFTDNQGVKGYTTFEFAKF